MGFFGALSKIIQGKPVFEANQQPQQQGSAMPGAPTPAASVAAGPKEYPRLVLGRVQCHMSGDDMEVEVEIQNESSQQLDLDQVRILGTAHDLGTFLRPGEEREFRLYEGDRPRSTSNSRVEVTFRTTPGGDYFQADFTIDFKQEADGTYSVQRFRPLQVRDI